MGVLIACLVLPLGGLTVKGIQLKFGAGYPVLPWACTIKHYGFVIYGKWTISS